MERIVPKVAKIAEQIVMFPCGSKLARMVERRREKAGGGGGFVKQSGANHQHAPANKKENTSFMITYQQGLQPGSAMMWYYTSIGQSISSICRSSSTTSQKRLLLERREEEDIANKAGGRRR
jgi:hypothetical protein